MTLTSCFKVLEERQHAAKELTWVPGRNRYGVQGVHLNPLSIFLRTYAPCIWLSALLNPLAG